MNSVIYNQSPPHCKWPEQSRIFADATGHRGLSGANPSHPCKSMIAVV